MLDGCKDFFFVSFTENSQQPFSPDGDNLIKVAILGAPGVGKTSIIQVKCNAFTHVKNHQKMHYRWNLWFILKWKLDFWSRI